MTNALAVYVAVVIVSRRFNPLWVRLISHMFPTHDQSFESARHCKQGKNGQMGQASRWRRIEKMQCGSIMPSEGVIPSLDGRATL